jgi:hypothetical protein
MITIATYATKSYFYAWEQCVKAIAAAAQHHKNGNLIFVTDTTKESDEAVKIAQAMMLENWKIHTIKLPFDSEGNKNYDIETQLRIAKMQEVAFHFARSKLNANMLLSVEADVIIPPHALKTLEWVLEMPSKNGGNLYDIAFGTYPNQLFLGGFGTPQHPISEDFLPEERILKSKLQVCLKACNARLNDPDIKDDARTKEEKRLGRLHNWIKRSQPDGNIWQVIAKYGWRRRGWMDFAYPGIGEGCVIPVDWCGLGCTLLSKKALAVSDFLGYEGRGTQDLFLCWNRWHPAGMRIGCSPHVVCHHVKNRDGKIVLLEAYHETIGECRGHLRVREKEWIPI